MKPFFDTRRPPKVYPKPVKHVASTGHENPVCPGCSLRRPPVTMLNGYCDVCRGRKINARVRKLQ